MGIRGVGLIDADDGKREPSVRRRIVGRSGNISVDAFEACLSASLPIANRLFRASVAKRRDRCSLHGFGTRGILPRLLLGLDGAVVLRRYYESAMDHWACSIRAVGENRTGWSLDRTIQWRRFNRLGYNAFVALHYESLTILFSCGCLLSRSLNDCSWHFAAGLMSAKLCMGSGIDII